MSFRKFLPYNLSVRHYDNYYSITKICMDYMLTLGQADLDDWAASRYLHLNPA